MSNQTAELSVVHMVQVKYLGPTNAYGARVKLTSLRFDNNHVILSRDYTTQSVLDQSVDYLRDNGYNPVSVSEWNRKGYLIGCEVFKPLQ